VLRGLGHGLSDRREAGEERSHLADLLRPVDGDVRRAEVAVRLDQRAKRQPELNGGERLQV
jgi:hypothetical protein